MNLLRFLCGLPDGGLHPGDEIKVLDDSGEVVLATYKGKGKHARGRVVVTYTQGRYTGIDQYVARERVVGLVGKKAEPVLAHHGGWNQMKEVTRTSLPLYCSRWLGRISTVLCRHCPYGEP